MLSSVCKEKIDSGAHFFISVPPAECSTHILAHIIFYDLQIALPHRFIVFCLFGISWVRRIGVERAGGAVAQADS